MTRHRTVWGLLVIAVSVLAATLLPVAARGDGDGAGQALEIKVLSNRADLVSGGDALVEVVLPAGTNPADVIVDDDGRNVTDAFALGSDGRYTGTVRGFDLGENVLTARLGDGTGTQITVTNHALGESIFSGPLIQPWACKTGSLDASCTRPAAFTYSYKSTGGGAYLPYDPASPPADVANTTTDEGKTVPHIVRLETGVILRDEYRIAVLFDPAKPPATQLDGFNNKMVITHGASCDTGYAEAAAPDVMNETALSRGFVVMSHALNNAGHNCNIVTEAESLIMTKEHVQDNYGELRWTIGSGCSGGGLAQYHMANAYPGLYQGISPGCSFPDAWSSGQYEDYHLLLDYYKGANKWDPGVVWDYQAVAAVLGHPNPANPVSFNTAIPDKGPPGRSCPGVPVAQVYNKTTNPTGVRCTFQDYMVNVFGRRPQDGFARRPWDNTGVQYGLRGLRSGKVSVAQFIDVNTKVGGRTIDHEPMAPREEGDEFALNAAYRSGAINGANHLDKVAIIDLRMPDPGAFHDVYRAYALRARLEREFGHADNQLLWRLSGSADDAILALDKWIGAVMADKRDIPLAQKYRLDRPADVTHRCTAGGRELAGEVCDVVVESYSTPRIEADMPFTDDVMKCQLEPMSRTEYMPRVFSDAQWAKLQTAFPGGVCDYSKPGVGMQDTIAWQTYERIYGGEPLGPAPVSQPFST